MAEKVTFNGKPLISSKYLEAADLNGKRVTVVIERIVRGVEFHNKSGGKDKKPVFYLRGKEKGWALNTTNLNRIAEVHGKNAETWIGKAVVIFPDRVDSFGSMVPAVRVDVEATKEVASGAASSPRANGGGKRRTEHLDESRQQDDTGDSDESSSDDNAMADAPDPGLVADIARAEMERAQDRAAATDEVAALKARLAAAEKALEKREETEAGSRG